jgi:hypothetical protein
MKRLLTLAAAATLCALFAFACYKPYPADLDTMNLTVVIGRTTPADMILVLGEPSSHVYDAGTDTYVFTFRRSVLSLFVDSPGQENDKTMIIDGAEDQLTATFFDDVLTGVW